MSAINLTKNQTVNLSKAARSALRQITLGVGWDMAAAKVSTESKGFFGRLVGSSPSGPVESIDLDASALLFDTQGRLVDSVYFRQLRSHDGSVSHSGDNLTGEGDGDDEQIKLDLERLPAQVAHVVFTVSSFRGQSFDHVANAFCRVVNNDGGAELARINLSAAGSHTAILLAKLSRDSVGGFQFTALSEMTQGRTVNDLVATAQRAL